MKPPPFSYRAPRSVAEATAELGDAGALGKVLAGGQSLMPLLNMRLIAPAVLVDVNRVEGLDRITVDGNGVTVGATVRQADLERHAGAAAAQPLLAQALPLVAHPVIRNRGTVVGSIAHADPAAELPAVLTLTAGEVTVASHHAPPRTIAAEAFFKGPLEADLAPGDFVTAVRFPALAPGASTAFLELSRRHGDYALCGIAALVERRDGGIARAAVATVGVHPTPLVIDVTGPAAEGRLDDAGTAVAERIEPDADLHASAAYRRHLARVLTVRALQQALAEEPV